MGEPTVAALNAAQIPLRASSATLPARSPSSRRVSRCSSRRTSTPPSTRSVSRRASGAPSAVSATGTTPSRPTDPMRALWPAAAAAVVLVAVGALGEQLPASPCVRTSSSLRRSRSPSSPGSSPRCTRCGAWAIGSCSSPSARFSRGALLTWADPLPLALPLANVAKVVGASALGLWVAENLERASWVVLVAAVSAVVDVLSVYGGPTTELLEEDQLVGYFTRALTWFGYASTDGLHSAGHQRRGLLQPLSRRRATLRAARRRRVLWRWWPRSSPPSSLALWWEALPALPLLSVAFLAVNADRLGGCAAAATSRRRGRAAETRPAAPGALQASRTNRATVSTWCVCGNMSTGATREPVAEVHSSAPLPASVVGLHET